MMHERRRGRVCCKDAVLSPWREREREVERERDCKDAVV